MRRWQKSKFCPTIDLNMKIYQVGGAVRDRLLGLAVQDIDYVVVGATPQQMIDAGYRPVGKDFPVFLHPTTHAEYALARTERKSAPGYHGFVFHCAPDVTLEEDLLRRDLTINAMAVPADVDAATAAPATLAPIIIDPYHGQRDLAHRVFRHVSDAFAEDPVRILRVARFAARFSDFTIAPETMLLMRSMVTAGEVDALVAERVWQELARGLMEHKPSRLLQVLQACGALERIIPELDWPDQDGTPRSLATLDFAADQQVSLSQRWAALLTDTFRANPDPEMVQKISIRLRVPVETRDIAMAACRDFAAICAAVTLPPESVLQLLERCDAFRRPARFDEIVGAARCVVGMSAAEFQPSVFLQDALNAAQSIPAAQIAQQVSQQFPRQPEQIAHHIFRARADAIRSRSTAH